MREYFDLKLDGLAHDGRGIGHLKEPGQADKRGLTVFVSGGLPGQKVRLRITAHKPRYLEAVAERILEPSPDAIPALCPHAGTGCAASGCGGCPLQTMPYSRQLEWKTRLARDALLRIGGIDEAILKQAWAAPRPAPALAGFRNRMTFAFGTLDGRLVLGQRTRGEAGVVETPGCILLPEGARQLLAEAQAIAMQSGLPAWRAPERRGTRSAGAGGFWRFLTLRQGWLAGESAPRWWVLCLTSPGGPKERTAVVTLGERLLSLGGAAQLGGFVHEERSRPDALALGERRIFCLDAAGMEKPEAALLHLPLGGRLFELDVASFFQVNSGAAELLAQTLMEMTPQNSGKGLLDICCGVGAPGQLIASRFSALLGLEQDKRAIACAKTNAKMAELSRFRYLAGDAATLLQSLAKGERRFKSLQQNLPSNWSMALVDPPRAGLAPKALQALLQRGPEYILYVSCNPATLARDAAKLSERYRLKSLTAIDLFPHTPHLECCSLWKIKSA